MLPQKAKIVTKPVLALSAIAEIPVMALIAAVAANAAYKHQMLALRGRHGFLNSKII